MPTTNEEARKELLRLRQERDVINAWLARRISRNQMWVSQKLSGKSPLFIDDYNALKNALILLPEGQ